MSERQPCSSNPDTWHSKHQLARADLASLEFRIFAFWNTASEDQKRTWVDKENRLKDILLEDDELVPPF